MSTETGRHRPEAVIFDLGNVLAFHDNELLCRRLAERCGLTAAVVAERLAEPALWDGVNRGALDAAGIHQEVSRALQLELEFEQFIPLWSSHFTLNEQILPLVESLVGHVKLLLLSNTNAGHAAYLRPLLPVLDRFDYLLYSHDVGLVKPEAAFFQLALERLDLPAAAVAFFDDFPPFVEAARALGIRAFVYRDLAGFRDNLTALQLLSAP